MIDPEIPVKPSTREKILSVAMRLFAQNGYSATSIRQITQEVGVRESSLYNHFPSKDEILQTLLSNHGFGFVKTILEKDYLNRDIEDPHQFLTSIIDDILNRWEEEEDRMFWQVLYMEMFREPSARQVYIRDLDASRAFLVQLFKKLQDKNLIKPIDPWHLSNEFLGVGLAMHIEYLILVNEGSDITAVYRDFRQKHADFFWNAIKMD